MSRPFSYNDENFTVIGNVLYVHFKYEQAAEPGTMLIEIPPAICDRLLFFSSFGMTVFNVKNSNAGQVVLAVIDHDSKYYLTNKNTISAGVGKYIFGTFMLKDI
jgi:hypothetical protein|nr:MAG TPA: hypothetical protein [Caudoviricetes sp.]